MTKHRLSEPASWLALTDHDVKLPAELVELAANRARIDAERAAFAAAQPARSAPSEIAAGVAPLDAVNAASQGQHQKTSDQLARQATRAALKNADRLIRIYIQSHRDELIEQTARPVVDAILSDAAKVAEDLAGIGVGASAETIAMHATPTEAKAWRKAQALNVRLNALQHAWHVTWMTACISAGQEQGAVRPDRWLRPGAPGGIHAWTDPLAVTNRAIRDGENRDAIAISQWRDVGGYRLATIAEVAELTSRAEPGGFATNHGVPGILLPAA